MKSFVTTVGILLTILGVLALGYQGFTYTKQEQIAQIADVKVTADTQKTVYFPPYLGGASLVAGIILLIISRKK